MENSARTYFYIFSPETYLSIDGLGSNNRFIESWIRVIIENIHIRIVRLWSGWSIRIILPVGESVLTNRIINPLMIMRTCRIQSSILVFSVIQQCVGILVIVINRFRLFVVIFTLIKLTGSGNLIISISCIFHWFIQICRF